MDSLLAIFAAPAAASGVLSAVGEAVGAATRPFAEVMAALTREPAAPSNADLADDELHERIADRLQAILEAAGAAPGDCATVSFDAASERVDLDHCPSVSEDEVAAAIEADAQLMSDLQQMAEIDATASDRLELLVQSV